ncbi:MAG: glycosyltransferase family 39 protein [Acidobacteriota bacterium]
MNEMVAANTNEADQSDKRLRLTRRLIFTLPPGLVFIAALTVHLQVIKLNEDYVGALLTLDRVFDLSLALLLTAIGFCVGRRIFRLLGIVFDSPAEELAFSSLSGIGVIGLGVLFLGLMGLLRLAPVIILLALLLAVAFREIPELFNTLERLFFAAIKTRWRIGLALLLAALIINLLLRAATPIHSFDEAIYHLSVAQKFVDQGRVYPVLDNWAGNGPFLIQMIYAVCLLAKADIASKLFSLILAVLGLLALYAFGKRFFGHRVGVIAMLAFFGAGMVVEVAVTARVDVTLALGVFLATYAMMVYFESQKSAWLYISAALSGLSLGVKYTAGIWLLLLAVMYLVESFIRRSTGFLTIIKRGLVYAAIAAAVASPWFIKNAFWFHNPVYPFVTGEVAEMKASEVRYFNAEDEKKLEEFYQDARAEDMGLASLRQQQLAREAMLRIKRHPLRVWEYFTKPDVYNMAEEFHYPNYLFVITPLALLFFKRRRLLWLAFFSVAFFLSVTSTSWVGRILLPVYPPLTVIVAYLLSKPIEWSEKFKWRKILVPITTLLIGAIVGTAVGYSGYLNFKQMQKARAVDFIGGKISRRAFMKSQFYFPPLDFINHQLPTNARILMLGAQMSYGLQRDYLAEVNWDSTEWRRLLIRNQSFNEVSEDLKRQGVTHILFTDSLFKWVALMGRDNYPNVSGKRSTSMPDYRVQLRNWTTFDIYSRNFLEPIYTDQMGYILYKIK